MSLRGPTPQALGRARSASCDGLGSDDNHFDGVGSDGNQKCRFFFFHI